MHAMQALIGFTAWTLLRVLGVGMLFRLTP